ncbi:MAG TPA: hypothetical protein PLM41_22575 [Saprospiraceae bacterium]|nr:hypothetical protein [Saprospiraceae bacterium]
MMQAKTIKQIEQDWWNRLRRSGKDKNARVSSIKSVHGKRIDQRYNSNGIKSKRCKDKKMGDMSQTDRRINLIMSPNRHS